MSAFNPFSLVKKPKKPKETKKKKTPPYSKAGWVDDYSEFVLGDKIITKNKNGEVVIKPRTAPVGFHALHLTKGDIEKTIGLLKALESNKLHLQLALFFISLASPLYRLTGLNGLILSLFGPTGAGKTLSQLIGQSAFGNPTKSHIPSRVTEAALLNLLASYNNLMVSIDEITYLGSSKIRMIAYTVSQGEAKLLSPLEKKIAYRLEKVPEIITQNWSAPLVVSTNASLLREMSAYGLAAGALASRIIEVKINRVPPTFSKSTKAGAHIHRTITENHGHIGLEFVKYLMKLGEQKIKDELEELGEYTSPYYKFKGTQRYYELLFNTTHYACNWYLLHFGKNNSASINFKPTLDYLYNLLMLAYERGNKLTNIDNRDKENMPKGTENMTFQQYMLRGPRLTEDDF